MPATLSDVLSFAEKATATKLCPGYELEVEELTKRFRLVMITSGDARSAYGFVDKATGDIFKSASWAVPAKGVRGNIFSDNATDCCQQFSIVYNSPGRRKG